MDKIIGKYRIEYSNGFVQEKNLISHSDYLNIIKPTQDLIYDLFKAGEKGMAELKKSELIETFGEHYFTNESPMYYAISTGVMALPEHQGTHLLKVELIS